MLVATNSIVSIVTLLMKYGTLLQDQMSHRIIEKRRRDRMNNCLANLGQLIPVNYLKQVTNTSILTLVIFQNIMDTFEVNVQNP